MSEEAHAPEEAAESPFETCDFRKEDLDELIQVFRDAIRLNANEHYSAAQLDAWAKKADDRDAFAASLDEGWVRVAVDDDGIVGFAQINMPGHIAMLHTAPRVARQGVGTLLLDDMLALGEAMGADVLTVEASSVARDLFAFFGFTETATEVVERHGVSFTRHLMQRSMKQRRK